MRRPAIIATTALLMLPAPALAADTWVSPLGNDLNACTTAAPCLTTQRASLQMPDGGTMTITGDLPNQTLNNYRPTAPATVVCTRGVLITRIDAKGTKDVTFDGLEQCTTRLFNFERSTGPTGSNTQRITVRGQTNVGSVRFLNSTTDLTIDNNFIRHGNVGITAPGRTTPADASSRVTITGNTIANMDQDAIQMSDVTDVVIEDNAIRDIHDSRASTDPPTCHTDGTSENPGLPSCYHSDGIQTAGGASNWTIKRNLIQATSQGIILQGNTPAVPRPTIGVTVRQNLIVGPTNAAMFNGVYLLDAEQNIACGTLNGILYSWYSTSATPTDGIIRDNIVSSYFEQAPAVADDTGNRVVDC